MTSLSKQGLCWLFAAKAGMASFQCLYPLLSSAAGVFFAGDNAQRFDCERGRGLVELKVEPG